MFIRLTDCNRVHVGGEQGAGWGSTVERSLKAMSLQQEWNFDLKLIGTDFRGIIQKLLKCCYAKWDSCNYEVLQKQKAWLTGES